MAQQPDERSAAEKTAFFGLKPRVRSEAPARLAQGVVLDGYRLLSLIGQGGMGQVWEAEQIAVGNRKVALKFVRPDRLSERSIQLFKREARASGRLNHEGIVRVYDYGEKAGLAWIAMEYIDGCWTLKDALEDQRSQPFAKTDYDEKVAGLFLQIAEAMGAAHRAGVIHRDLKPQNILITSNDRPKITDFGLARIQGEEALSRSGEVQGTVYYMSPEQVAGSHKEIDHRSDIFSLGVVLYEALTLHNPFSKDGAARALSLILNYSPPWPNEVRPTIPSWLSQVCMTAMAKDRLSRFQSMDELAEAIRQASPVDGVQAHNRQSASPRYAGKRFIPVALVGCAVLCTYAAIGGWMRLDIDGRAREAAALPRSPVVMGGVSYENPAVARLDADASQLFRFFPWAEGAPSLLVMALTVVSFGALGGCVGVFVQLARREIPSGVVAAALSVASIAGLLVAGTIHGLASTHFIGTRLGVLILMATGFITGVFVTFITAGRYNEVRKGAKN